LEWSDIAGAIWALEEIGGACDSLAEIVNWADIYFWDEELFLFPGVRIDGQAFCESCEGSSEYSGNVHVYSGGDINGIHTHEAIHYLRNVGGDHLGDFTEVEATCNGLARPSTDPAPPSGLGLANARLVLGIGAGHQ
jgi:hypothetical protein